MQQVFQQMDGVMQRNRETRRRDMRIRTYRVIPLKPQTGVIEWVLNTIPLLEYLERAHVSVNPTDWKWSICRKRISDATHLEPEDRLRIYQDVCRHFKPVLRYFFFDYFKDPDTWLSRRISYSRSVAASSMIGHVLGLGDRHGQNILLDKKTGEVVHIDLGVAFEQVLSLPIYLLTDREKCYSFRRSYHFGSLVILLMGLVYLGAKERSSGLVLLL